MEDPARTADDDIRVLQVLLERVQHVGREIEEHHIGTRDCAFQYGELVQRTSDCVSVLMILDQSRDIVLKREKARCSDNA